MRAWRTRTRPIMASMREEGAAAAADVAPDGFVDGDAAVAAGLDDEGGDKDDAAEEEAENADDEWIMSGSV